MGVNYATVITQPTEAERREQLRLSAIRQAYLPTAQGRPLPPVTHVTREADRANICRFADEVCGMYLDLVAANGEVQPSDWRETLAAEFGIGHSTVEHVTRTLRVTSGHTRRRGPGG